mmetsp:Transcript_17202/g.34407  ORF Transcript_17202/g.34407 Transcript_17202/m.34407 type:complete len:158 (+) Transcript_17202:3-476(+)
MAVCEASMGAMSYTIIRPTYLGNSSFEASFAVKPSDVVIGQGDHLQGSVTRAEVGALAAEVVFLPGANSVVVEVASSQRSIDRQLKRSVAELGDKDAKTWEEMLSWMRTGDGRYISPKQLEKLNLMRDLQAAWLQMALEEDEFSAGVVPTSQSPISE